LRGQRTDVHGARESIRSVGRERAERRRNANERKMSVHKS